MQNFKPCPLCGGTRVEVIQYAISGPQIYHAYCSDCCATTIPTLSTSEQEAVAEWNRFLISQEEKVRAEDET